MKKISISLLFLLLPLLLFAQMMDPVKFSSSMKMLGGDQAEIVFSAKIDPGWHVYSTNLGDAGPIEASFHGTKMDGVELVGKLTPRGKEINHFDNMFGCNLRYFEKSAQFVQKIKFTKPNYDINCYLEWGACNDEMCMPPGEATFKQKGKSPAIPASEVKDEKEKMQNEKEKT